MIARTARVCPPDRPGGGSGRRVRRRWSGHPARVADHDRPAVARGASHGPPDEIRLAGRVIDASHAPRSARQAMTSGSAAIASSRPASSVVRGHDRVDVEVLRRRVVVAADRPQAVEARDAHARRSCWHRTRRRSPHRGPRSPGARATACACSTSRPLRASFSIGHQRAIGLELDRRVRRPRSPRRSGGPRPRRLRAPRATTARTSTSSVHCSGTTLGRVPPPITPTLTVTPGQRPLSACSSVDDPGGLEDRAAALLGLDAGVRRPTVDVEARVQDPLSGGHDVAVGAGAFEDERGVHLRGERADVRRRGRRADLLVRVGHEHEALERAGRRRSAMIALSA